MSAIKDLTCAHEFCRSDFTLKNIVLTSDSPWNPRDSAFAQQENVARSRLYPIIHEISSADRIIPCPELMSITELKERLVSCVYISSDDGEHEGLESTDGRRIQAIATKEKKTVITQETLARQGALV
jgi:hypothetical protein